MSARSLQELLQLIGRPGGLPLMEVTVGEAYRDGAITMAEAKILQRYARLTPKSQKRALKEQADVSADDIAEMRAKLEALSAKLWPDREAD